MKTIKLNDKHDMFTITYTYYEEEGELFAFVEHKYSGLKNIVTDLTVTYPADDCSDSNEKLAFVCANYLRAYEFYADKYYLETHLDALLDIASYSLDLFSGETYNGWMFDEYAESQGIGYDEAVFEIFVYAIAKLMFQLHLNNNQ